jgi:hypothetical protein
MQRTQPDDEDEPRELLRAPPAELAGADAVARLLEQSNREAAAGRAQARELVKALEGVQRSQEYLGTALLAEKRRSRLLIALLVLAPIGAAAGAWLLVDALRADVGRVEQLVGDERAARVADAAKFRDTRAAELASDIDALRRDLDASREALADERSRLADREKALAAAESRGESAKAEVGLLGQEIIAVRARANAEQGRAVQLEEKLTAAQAALAARTAAAAAPPPEPESAPPAVAASEAAAKPETPAAPQSPEAAADADQTRAALNVLLEQSGDAVRYRFESIESVAGRALRGVLVVGADADGTVLRSIQAKRAEISVDPATASVVLRFFDGKLIVGGKQAPFFDGTYGLVVRGDAAKWKASGLAAETGE